MKGLRVVPSCGSFGGFCAAVVVFNLPPGAASVGPLLKENLYGFDGLDVPDRSRPAVEAFYHPGSILREIHQPFLGEKRPSSIEGVRSAGPQHVRDQFGAVFQPFERATFRVLYSPARHEEVMRVIPRTNAIHIVRPGMPAVHHPREDPQQARSTNLPRRTAARLHHAPGISSQPSPLGRGSIKS